MYNNNLFNEDYHVGELTANIDEYTEAMLDDMWENSEPVHCGPTVAIREYINGATEILGVYRDHPLATLNCECDPNTGEFASIVLISDSDYWEFDEEDNCYMNAAEYCCEYGYALEDAFRLYDKFGVGEDYISFTALKRREALADSITLMSMGYDDLPF